MALAFYMDVHVPAAITDSLRRREIDVLTRQEDNTRTASDVGLLTRSTELQRVLVSQDTDFFSITSEWLEAERDFFGLVFAPQLSISIGKMVEDLELIAQCYLEDEVRNSVIFLPL